MEEEASTNSINHGDRASNFTNNETTPLQRDKVHDEGLKYIISTFTVVTIILTIALGVAISQDIKQVDLLTGTVSDQPLCTDIGKEIYKTGGNAVDVAIAVTICLGVVLPHLTGIGGNTLLLVYNQKTEKSVLCLDSWTPGTNGLPKLILAFHEAHHNAGKKPWKKLIEPSIKIAREGFPVTESLMQSQNHLTDRATKNLRNLLLSLKAGVNTSSPELADALTHIMEEGPDALYKGSLSSDIKEHYGDRMISEWKLNENQCAETIVKGFRLVSSGKGSGGPLIHDTILNANITDNYTIQHLINYFQGKDEMTWPYPSGVVVSTVDDQDIYVSIVSGLGPVLGSQNLSNHGFIYGSNLVLPNSKELGSIGAAFIAGETSSRCKKRIITGAVDVRDLLQVLPGLLWGQNDVQTVVEAARARFGSNGLLAETNHAPSFQFPLPPAPLPYPAINVIEKIIDNIIPYADSRGGL